MTSKKDVKLVFTKGPNHHSLWPAELHHYEKDTNGRRCHTRTQGLTIQQTKVYLLKELVHEQEARLAKIREIRARIEKLMRKKP